MLFQEKMGDLRTCVDNLRVCKASCCKQVSFNVPRTFKGIIIPIKFCSDDKKKYYEYHGFKVFRNRQRGYDVVFQSDCMVERKHLTKGADLLIVKAKCQKLGNDNLCLIHKFKPFVCTALNWETYETKRFTLTKGCIFGGK